MVKKVQSRKQKGRRLQQWVRDKIRYYYQLDPQDVRSTSMGAGGEDVQLSSYAQRLFPFSIECKNIEKINVWKSYDQAVANSTSTSEALLIMKKNRRNPLAVVDADVFIKLVRVAYAAQAGEVDET